MTTRRFPYHFLLAFPALVALVVSGFGCGTGILDPDQANPTIVSGIVTDQETGEPLSGVRIQERRTVETIEGPQEEYVDQTTTDAGGIYSLTVPANREYERRWFKEGYAPRTFRLPDDARRTSTYRGRLDVVLAPEEATAP